MSKERSADLSVPGKDGVELPVHEGTDGPDAVDITSIYKQTGCFTYDPGFVSTASCESKITYIDGGQGLLRYRGYPIEQLAENGTYAEVVYLLLYGELPKTDELERFNASLADHMPFTDSRIPDLLASFSRDAHPMAMLMAALSALAAQYHEETDIHDADNRDRATHRLIAQVATIFAAIFQYRRGGEIIAPRKDLSYCDNLLHMMSAENGDLPLDDTAMRAAVVRAMDVILILHADHEQNASTSTVRMAGSTDAGPYAAVVAGVCALWGPAHGGANEAVIRMLGEMISSGKPLSEYIDRAKDKSDPFRLMGFGHRVYKNYDPRATIIREICHELLSDLKDEKDKDLLDAAIELERTALEDPYFVKRKLYPNVDFYSGIIFKALGIDSSMFTAIFALSRTSGWISHWNEMLAGGVRLSRPRQLYTGSRARDYVPIKER